MTTASAAGAVDYSTKIPNNINLADDQRVLKALEKWHPGYIDWWMTMGPEGFQTSDVYLRTAISIDPKGWAKFDYVKMPEYRWGILLAPHDENRQVNFGAHKGEKAWQEVPGEYRAMLRRLIVIQGDTEPASVEQQRHLGKTAPSLYDMRNLFQVNVEEGRHLWAMVYLLQKYFGKDGREEADGLLQRRSGDVDKPRMLGAFNEATPDWLSFFMFTFFTDRDGKMQLESLAQSGFDPMSRTCRFMLTEEAHHMFVGETGVGRTIERTCEAMKKAGIEDPYDINRIRALGVIDLPTIQKKANLHYSLSLDLFGSEISTNAANFYNSGLKGRFMETTHRGRSPPDERDLSGSQAHRRPDPHRRRTRADRHQHAPPRRLLERLPGRRLALEQDHREGRHQVRHHVAVRRLPSPRRRVQERPRLARWQAAQRNRMGQAARPVAPVERRWRLHCEPHAALLGPRRIRQLDRVAENRHRQQRRRLRIRENPSRLIQGMQSSLRVPAGLTE